MHLVSRADLHAVIPYGQPRIRTRKDPRLSLSPDSSAELKAAMPRPSEGAAAPSEQSGTKSPSFCFLPAAVPVQNRAHRRTVSHKSKSPDRHRVWCQSGDWAVGREWLSPLIWRHALQNKTKKGVERLSQGSRSARKTRKRCRWVQRRNRGVIGMPFPTRF